ncbi:hypothetical protein BGZ80_009009 [Entomortierella chlamydospora]|uniref:Nucleoside transporter family n=1 Tax=Entomortierella chlamydospora TaxID=101097 RepID=A0A9P6T4Q9_9FUNG|nr:hypothetical protein BGZ80_009009 [Entomortierella chlamydospora]
MPASADETTPLCSEIAPNNSLHLEVPPIDNDDDADDLETHSLLRHTTVEDEPPSDPWHLSYWIMVLQGASMLLPWNVFITAQGFFKLKFTGSPFENNFQNYFSVAFMGTNLLVVGGSILIQKKGLAGAGVAISQIVTQILSPPKGSTYKEDYLSVSSLAGRGDFNGGRKGKSEGLEHSAFLFFSFALAFTVISVLAQALLIRLPIYEYYTLDRPCQPIEFLAPPSTTSDSHAVDEAVEGVLNSTHGRRNSDSSAVTTVTITPAMIAEANRRHAEEAAEREAAERVSHYRSTSLGATVLATDASAEQLMEEIYPKKKHHPLVILYITITLVFGLTLSLFPSLTALVESTNTDPKRPRIFGDLFVPLHFLIYNVGDWSGRTLPSISYFTPNTRHPTRKQQVRYLLSALGRLAFIPIFLTANLPIPQDKRLLPFLIQNDAVWFLLLFLFALSNGYIGSIVMMVGPSCVLGGENKSRAGVKLGFWLTTGLALGSVASFGVRQLMCAKGGCSV